MVRNSDPIERLRTLLGPEDEIIISNTNGGIELTVDRDHLEMLQYFKMFCYILFNEKEVEIIYYDDKKQTAKEANIVLLLVEEIVNRWNENLDINI